MHIYRNLVAAASSPRARRAAAGSVPRCPYKILDLSLLPSTAYGTLRAPGRHRLHRIADGAHAIIADAERRSRVLQCALNALCDRVCATEYASRGPFRLLERRYGLAQIAERGVSVAGL